MKMSEFLSLIRDHCVRFVYFPRIRIFPSFAYPQKGKRYARDPVREQLSSKSPFQARPLAGTSMVLIAYLNMHNRDDNDSAPAEHSAVRCAYVTRMQFPYACAYTDDRRQSSSAYAENR